VAAWQGRGHFAVYIHHPVKRLGGEGKEYGLRALREQVDIVIYDRQYSPFLFNQNGAKCVAAESVYIRALEIWD
jgi:hypothetical protein